jgi:hypothetical protein
MIPVDTCEPFFKNMRMDIELNDDIMQLIASHMSEMTFPQKHILLREGYICNKIYFIVAGTARSYYTDVSGMTITWSFHFNNNKSITRNLFAVDYRGFLKPTVLYCDRNT